MTTTPDPNELMPDDELHLMATVYEAERARYVGGSVYYQDNKTAFMACMNAALYARASQPREVEDYLCKSEVLNILINKYPDALTIGAENIAMVNAGINMVLNTFKIKAGEEK